MPEMVHLRRVHQDVETSISVAVEVSRQLAPVLSVIKSGDSVAVGVGSRGIARIAELVTAVTDVLRAHGARPYIIPAMGSHGGATAEGQLAVLADLGISQDRLGVPVEASMDTLVIGEAAGMKVHVARAVSRADHVLVVNRLKSHTSFAGRIESGLAKMVAVGLGKQRGAEELHRRGPLELEERIVAACELIRSEVPLLGGLAIIENRRKGIESIHFLDGSQIGGPLEIALLEKARQHEARLPFNEIDVLIVDTMGKEISGTGMDTNVIGRRMVRGSPEPAAPTITNVVVLSLSAGSEGNAIGVGLADFIPVTILGQIDLGATYANALTAGLQGVQRAQIPIILATDRDAVAAALLTAGLSDLGDAKVVRIRNTLALDEILISPNLLPSATGHQQVAHVRAAALFDDGGSLTPWPDSRPPSEAHT